MCIRDSPLADGVAVSMGNPHAIFFVEDIASIDLATHGSALEHNHLFPERANISIVYIHNRGEITQRVWERGAGLTLACGSGACAAVVACHARDLTDQQVTVHLPGGDLQIHLEASGDVIMRGPVSEVFKGKLPW